MQERYIAAVDLGTSRIAVSVARVTGADVQVLYYKESASDGVRHSSVYNPVRASKPLGEALKEAENELGIKIMQVVVGLPRWMVHQESGSARLDRTDPDDCITQEEIDSLKSIALDSYPLDDNAKEEIYGAVAQSFSADDLINQPECDIVGATGEDLTGNFRIFVGAKKAVSNIDRMLAEIGVAPAAKVFLPHAVAGAVLTDEEKDNGVALIEMGGGVTSVSIYQGRILRYYGAIPFGGRSITTDIKSECGFKEVLAENIKLAYGACMPEKLQNLSEKILQVNDDETGSYETLPVKYLSEIITARAREIIDAVLFQIQESGYADRLRNGVVVTGGGAQMANFANLVKDMSGYNVRIGFPRAHLFNSEGCSGIRETSAVASAGLLLEAAMDPYLNCTTAPAARVEPEEAAPAEAEAVEETVEETAGSVFDPEAGKTAEKPRKPAKPRKAENRKGNSNVFWTKTKKKIGEALGNAFDNTIGGLYDGLDDNNQQ